MSEKIKKLEKDRVKAVREKALWYKKWTEINNNGRSQIQDCTQPKQTQIEEELPMETTPKPEYTRSRRCSKRRKSRKSHSRKKRKYKKRRKSIRREEKAKKEEKVSFGFTQLGKCRICVNCSMIIKKGDDYGKCESCDGQVHQKCFNKPNVCKSCE